MCASGGDSELTKCMHCTVSWQFTNKGRPQLKHKLCDCDVVIEKDDEEVKLTNYPVNESHQTLGFCVEPAAMLTDQRKKSMSLMNILK